MVNFEELLGSINKSTTTPISASSATDPLHIPCISDHFKLPITYNALKKKIPESLQQDLELCSSSSRTNDLAPPKDDDNEEKETTKTLYKVLFEPKSPWAKELVYNQWNQYYTSDKHFLEQSQELVKRSSNDDIDLVPKEQIAEISKIWKEVKSPFGFLEKYQYIDWKQFQHWNENPVFLQILSVYNIAAPVMSLILPILSIIIPYFILRFQGLSITVQEYFAQIKIMFSQNSLGKLFYHLSRFEISKCIYPLFTLAVYVFQIYMNILSCIRFVRNTSSVYDYLNKVGNYLDLVTVSMREFITSTKYIGGEEMTTYREFRQDMERHLKCLEEFHAQIGVGGSSERCQRRPFSIWSYQSLSELGHKMRWFYALHFDKNLEAAMLYSFGYVGFRENLVELSRSYSVGNIHSARFLEPELIVVAVRQEDDGKDDGKEDEEEKDGSSNKEANKKTKIIKNPILRIQGMHYPLIETSSQDAIKKNDLDITQKQIVLTGPNASGKTTFLKSALINVLLSQQTGFGYYDSYEGSIFEKLHCYLNIPDTSGRDSLFQAEARRCKEIINAIDDHSLAADDTMHFCIFDEIFSGTNPKEAVSSAYSFIHYLCQRKNVKFVLTTHFVELCRRLETNDSSDILNRLMKVHVRPSPDNAIEFLYQVDDGISEVEGGIEVLKQLNFPKEILNGL